MHVLHLAAECAPLAKVGGLGDVVSALPSALTEAGVSASILMPLYGGVDGAVATRAGALDLVHEAETSFGPQRLPFCVWRADESPLGVPVYLLDEPVHFGGPGIYAGAHGERLPPERWAVFQRAALDWLATPEAPSVDLLHLHDHHVGLVPVLLRHDRALRRIADTPTLLTVHSADHQGLAPWSVWERLNVHVDEAETLLVEDELNPLKAGVVWADAVTTVSPTYADELATDPSISRGLVETFRAARSKTTGVLNGIDAARWDPATDPHLPAPFSASDLAGKAETKRAVCAALGLDAARPLVAYIGRLTPEKGVELLTEGTERLLHATEASVAILGAGDPEHETTVRGLALMLEREGVGDRLSVTIGFDEALAHRLYGAADVFVMPSMVEPGGLAQRYAMRYGAPPVVHAVGGLRDTVAPWDGEAGTGFRFDAFTTGAFVEAVRAALAVHAEPDAWARLVANGMATDGSWHGPARTYADLYASLVGAVAV